MAPFNAVGALRVVNTQRPGGSVGSRTRRGSGEGGLRDVEVAAEDAALQDGEVTLDGVGVEIGRTYSLALMVDGAVPR